MKKNWFLVLILTILLLFVSNFILQQLAERVGRMDGFSRLFHALVENNPKIDATRIRDLRSLEEIKADGRRKIYLFGNSIVRGDQVPYRRMFSLILGDKLQKNIDIVNFGWDGCEYLRQFNTFKVLGLEELKSSQGVIFFLSVNDTIAPDDVRKNHSEEGLRCDLAPRRASENIEKSPWRHLRFPKRWVAKLDIKGLNWLSLLLNGARESFANEMSTFSKNIYYTNLLREPPNSLVTDLVIEELLKFKKELNKKGIWFRVVLLPTYLFSIKSQPDECTFCEEHKRRMETAGIQYYDFFPAFKNLSRFRYFHDYAHLDSSGHEFVANLLLEALTADSSISLSK